MYQKVLVPLDGSELAECVLPHIEAIANGCHAKTVVFVRVVRPLHLYEGLERSLSQEGRQQVDSLGEANAKSYLDDVMSRVKLGRSKVQSAILHGKDAESIGDYATQNGVDLIIIATHGRSGVSRWVWGNVAERIVYSACVPVLMVRPPQCVPKL